MTVLLSITVGAFAATAFIAIIICAASALYEAFFEIEGDEL